MEKDRERNIAIIVIIEQITLLADFTIYINISFWE